MQKEKRVVGRRTNDLRYESNDSREILKGSFSLSALRWLEVRLALERLERDAQKDFFSGGEGCGGCQLICCSIPCAYGLWIWYGLHAYWEINTTVIDLCASRQLKCLAHTMR